MYYYIGLNSTNKAKLDIDNIVAGMGFHDVASNIKETNAVKRFVRKVVTLYKVYASLQKGDILLIQYPYKKFFATLCNIAHRKGAKVITIIHDLGTFRRRKLTAEEEIVRLSHADSIIVHNEKMRQWLLEHGMKVPMVNLEIFDYIAEHENKQQKSDGKYNNVVFAGSLGQRKNSFIYDLPTAVTDCQFNIYGPGTLEDEVLKNDNIRYCGCLPSDEFVCTVQSDWGLVWDGDSIDGCVGIWGSYLKINNPHKTSCYLRAGLPVIVWKESAMADFVISNNVGIAVNSLSELNNILPSITVQQYEELKRNVNVICKRLNDGYYFKTAFNKAEKVIL